MDDRFVMQLAPDILGDSTIDVRELGSDVTYRIQVKPVTVAPRTPTVPQGRDTFETPRYATDLIIPYIPPQIKYVWECAAGNGKIADVFESNGYVVYRSDLRTLDRNYTLNFLESDYVQTRKDDSMIITNPPFSIKDKFIEKAFSFGVPFAFLINADYSGQQIEWIRRGCEKIIPNRRIDYITPTGRNGKTSSSQFHSMWLTYGFNLGRTETFVDLPIQWKKERI